MKTLENFGIREPEILLPADKDVSVWPVIACDQYTQDRNYWKKVEETVGDRPSTLNLVLPEVYLNDRKEERIAKIRRTMTEYISGNVFDEARRCFVYVERTTPFGRMRKGLVAMIDLDTYDWKPFTRANIRATEATIVDRIPPRMEIRRGAPLELPHIMLLADDPEHNLVEETGRLVRDGKPLYHGNLMCGGGSISGWSVDSDDEVAFVTEAVNRLAQKNTSDDGSVFLFAVGDGNHSLATAKAVWDEYRAGLRADGVSEDEISASPVRWALVEIVNIYDEGLTFEPIHRVVFDADSRRLADFVAERMGGTVTKMNSAAELEAAVRNSSSSFGFVFTEGNSMEFLLVVTDTQGLAVAAFQPVLDSFASESGRRPDIDYIHGADEVFRLGATSGVTGILLPPIAKDSFFETINGRGPLPRKSFSMGEADEKRFYLECRRLFG